jgi:hypothetical protein
MTGITSRERSDICAQIRRVEKVEKTAAKQRSAELLADVERQLSAMFEYDTRDNWATGVKIAEEAARRINAEIVKDCGALGIPPRFAPRLSVYWATRGENATKERRSELRTLAEAKIAAMEAQARTEIETRSVALQGKVLAESLTSDAARRFVALIPEARILMPRIDAQALLGGNGLAGSSDDDDEEA